MSSEELNKLSYNEVFMLIKNNNLTPEEFEDYMISQYDINVGIYQDDLYYEVNNWS